MLKTLHGYLSRDLIRVLILALIVLTLVMSIFAIIEPLRKRGLLAMQALQLFVLTVPVMVSLTLPVAALFAATMIYGRFSQDNELLACRASGISTVTTLRPALVMGLLVTVATLLLSNFVSPILARFSQAQLEANVRGLLVHELQSKGYFRHEQYLLHADHAEVTPQEGLYLEGVVLVDISRPEEPMVAAARQALIRTRRIGASTYATLRAREGQGSVITDGRRREQQLSSLGEQQLPPFPGFGEEEVAFFDWARLIEAYRKPQMHPEIREKMQQISREIRHSYVLQDILNTINDGKNYTKLKYRGQPMVLTAGKATWGKEGRILLDSDEGREVSIRLLDEQGQASELYKALSGRVSADWTPIEDSSFLTVELLTGVRGYDMSRPGEPPRQPGPIRRGEIPLPSSVVAQTNLDDPEMVGKILENPEEYTRNKRVISRIETLRRERVPRARREILGEMHGRIAYGLSCFLMVGFGAALGLIFRGGQLISAFALSILPAATVIVVIIMGKQLLTQEGVSELAGVATIWSGIVLLLIANAAVYWRLARR
jgi:lipopolysaccharide export LptBFGC system permease protein LptF